MEEYCYDGPAVIVQVLCSTSLILLKFFEDSDWMAFACLYLLCLRMECALMMVILKISNLSLAIYLDRCFSYGGCSSTIVATTYPSLHRILD
ncbi:hypothetical protein HanXRQr2_Chr16g0730771 [Helianthus annuus]|uniref:Uncharacterized protein n=1 Tax=Helianthus annuus TaxID=4232 RepID=A0A251RWH7_HELAN|nr:hypothetical protein HanXRQr2_Chr16g0730771 [Helianthus annuus]KAJ0436892.1 hypothetical protein HanHA300_Chr16g0595751 [Helianthus annuus]KAJ0459204.1 hypothetical protein HanHA89_Chr16g0646231 [Helianthus annuus]KAJ0639760.1 hypothetical protein HanLR1_Chr16g0607361 [Helianthus annuus]